MSIKFELEKAVSGTSSNAIGQSAPAKPQTAPTAPNGLVPVDNLVTCRNCGQENLAWQKSKLGKPYLCLGVMKDGKAYASRREFHECPARGSWPNTVFSE